MAQHAANQTRNWSARGQVGQVRCLIKCDGRKRQGVAPGMMNYFDQGLNFGENNHQTTLLLAQNIDWTRELCTRPYMPVKNWNEKKTFLHSLINQTFWIWKSTKIRLISVVPWVLKCFATIIRFKLIRLKVNIRTQTQDHRACPGPMLKSLPAVKC